MVIDSTPVTARTLRNRSVANLLRMGHCAPTVVQTALELLDSEGPWLVRLAAGLPGGIGNGGNECGGITAPLVLLGLRHARDPAVAGVPAVVYKAHALLQAFEARHGTTSCRDILGDARLPLRCIGVVRHAAERYADVSARGCAEAISGERREAYARLHAHLEERGFHCARAVVRRFAGAAAPDPKLLDATSAFVGGTAFAGMTCSALTAGVMLIGLELGEIEDSRLRVLRMIGTMAVRGNAFAEDLNAFNRAMNAGHELARWFTATFGGTQCTAVAGCDFATGAGVRRYAETDGVTRCGEIARRVAGEVGAIVEAARRARTPAGRARRPAARAPRGRHPAA